MATDISIKVHAKLVKDKKTDINIEFYGNGPTLEKIISKSEALVKDYIKTFQLKDIKKAEISYGDKEGLIKSTLERLFD